jgi:hypothetical protein
VGLFEALADALLLKMKTSALSVLTKSALAVSAALIGRARL